MFKGTLVENENYYKLRSKQLLYILLPSIAIGLFVNFNTIPLWVTIGAILFYVVIMILTFRNQKEIVKITNKKIEIDPNQIRLKHSNGTLLETIIINQDHKIKVKGNYKMAQETMNDLKEEIKGNVEKHFIVIEQNNEERRFDFEISLYYRLNQLNKVIKQWQKENFKIDYV